jgi:hypothetical protein
MVCTLFFLAEASYIFSIRDAHLDPLRMSAGKIGSPSATIKFSKKQLGMEIRSME